MEPISPDLVAFVGVIIVIIATFVAVVGEVIPRTTALLAGAALLILWGNVEGFFLIEQAIASISIQTLILLITMTVIANMLEKGGLFRYVAIRVAMSFGHSPRKLFFALSWMTFAFSTFTDNLTCVIIAGSLAIWLLDELRIDPRPFAVAILISSNTGGASTAIGDFPNLIISERAGISFLAFFAPTGMFWICVVIQGLVLLLLSRIFRKELAPPIDLLDKVAGRYSVSVLALQRHSAIENRRAVISGLVALVGALALFATESLHHLPPVEIALLAAVIGLIGSGLDHEQLIDHVGLRYVMAFIGLFILAGAADATGMIGQLGESLVAMTGSNPLLILIILPIPIAIVTAAVDAGPATAAFIPLMTSMEKTLGIEGHLVWWCLSLGVLAGSSATILGATAGTVAAGQVDSWYRLRHPDVGRVGFVAAFSRGALPAAALMLGIGLPFLVLSYLWLDA